MKAIPISVLLLALASQLQAAVQTKTIEYKEGDQVLEGYLAWDDATAGPRPGVLVVHEWTGLGDYVKMRCRKLAELGYVAFGADIYGKGVRPTPQEAGAACRQVQEGPEADAGPRQRRAWTSSAAIPYAIRSGWRPSAIVSAARACWSSPVAGPTWRAW